MPDFCSAYGCGNKRTIQTRSRGITFHKFPKDTTLIKKWELAVRRDGFVATNRSMLCSEHFKDEDFDRTGQIVRLRLNVIPSIFNFPTSLQKQEVKRNTLTAKKAEESLALDLTQLSKKDEPQKISMTQSTDHNYALPISPTALKAKLSEAWARMESLEREKRNAKIRELRAKKNMGSVLRDLREKNLINENLQDKLECYSDVPIELFSKKSHEYTKAQREFALTLHLHGPKAYSYLKESLHFHLPHPHTLQRWLTSIDAKPGLNKMMLDMLGRRCTVDHAQYGWVTLTLDAMAIKKHIQYNPQTQTMSGFVDMGDGLNETDVAS
ncbi:THAP domain-containing protein 6-like [Fundulus diaphanus]